MVQQLLPFIIELGNLAFALINLILAILGLLNPTKTCPALLGPFQQYNVRNATLSSYYSQAASLASLEYTRMQTLAADGIVSIGNPVTPVPYYLVSELDETKIINDLYDLLNYNFNVPPETVATYPGTVPNCTGSSSRIAADSNCSAAEYNEYQIQGKCGSTVRPGATLADLEMTRGGQLHCTLDDDNSECDLPSPRQVSLALTKILDLFPPLNLIIPIPNILSLFWGQFLAHDTAQLLKTGDYFTGNEPAACTANNQHLPASLKTKNAVPIDIDCDDPYFSKFNTTCMQFNRARTLNGNCSITRGNPLNSATSVLDLSTVFQIYNHTTHTYDLNVDAEGYMKRNEQGPIIAHINNRQHSWIATVHIIFCNFYDDVVFTLQTKYNITDGTLRYQIARRFTVAVYQYITYSQILATFIGFDHPLILENGTDTYNPAVTPSTSVEYDSAIGRAPHLFIVDEFYPTSLNFTPYDPVSTLFVIGNVNYAYTHLQEIICGMMFTEWKVSGISKVVRDQLFEVHGGDGIDLFATDVQRARDECTETYVQYLRRTQNACIESWADLLNWLPFYAVYIFKSVYKSFEDIDLPPALIAEFPAAVARFGPRQLEAFAAQYKNFKDGDEKFFEHLLTESEKSIIYGITLNDVVCIGAKLSESLNDARFGYFPFYVNEPVPCRANTVGDLFDLQPFIDAVVALG
jgi:hypothetical protein